MGIEWGELLEMRVHELAKLATGRHTGMGNAQGSAGDGCTCCINKFIVCKNYEPCVAKWNIVH